MFAICLLSKVNKVALHMTTKISVPLSEIDDQFLQDLKDKYPEGTRLDIQVVNLEDAPSFSEEDFWGFISLLDWSANNRIDVLDAAIEALSQGPISHIYLFEDMLATKLFLLDTRKHANAAYFSGHFSEDGFLYVRAAVVASGKEEYQRVLQDPTRTPTDQDFEPLLSLASRAFKKKTNSSFDYIPPTNYETYSNTAGW